MPASTPSSDTTPRITRAWAGKNGYAAQMIALPPSPARHNKILYLASSPSQKHNSQDRVCPFGASLVVHNNECSAAPGCCLRSSPCIPHHCFPPSSEQHELAGTPCLGVHIEVDANAPAARKPRRYPCCVNLCAARAADKLCQKRARTQKDFAEECCYRAPETFALPPPWWHM